MTPSSLESAVTRQGPGSGGGSGAADAAKLVEVGEAARIVERHPELPLPADTGTVDPERCFEQFGSLRQLGMGTVAEHETMGKAVARDDQVAQGNARVGAVRA